MLEYPSRPKFFANKIIRLLAKTCAAQQMGAMGTLLVTFVVATEDAAGYRRAVTFFNGQLLPLIGADSERSLVTARNKAVESGWLVYEKGGKGRAGSYYVTIPQHAEGVDDAPSDEGHDDICHTFVPTKIAGQTQGIRRESVGQSADILPIPIPKNINTQSGDKLTFLVGGRSPAFNRFISIHPRPASPEFAWQTWQAKVYQLSAEFKKTDAEIEEMLIKAAEEFRDSPAGQPPTTGEDYRLGAAKWLLGNCFEEPREMWKQPNGKQPKARGSPAKKDTAAVEEFFAQQGLGNATG